MQKAGWMIIATATIVTTTFATPLFAADTAAPGAPATAAAIKPQTTCPIMKGSEIDKRLFVDYQGKRIYVCCRSCVRILKADPAKYVALMEAEGITLDKTPDAKK
jgi:hypothetical protein